jgi:hypothetical protein
MLKIPETTDEMPYIEFRFNKKGKLIKLVATNSWWGGINSGFSSSAGYEGNTCKPKDLDRYIKAYKIKKVKEVEKEIEVLKNKLNNIKSTWLS